MLEQHDARPRRPARWRCSTRRWQRPCRASARMIPANPALSERSRARWTRGRVRDTRHRRKIEAPDHRAPGEQQDDDGQQRDAAWAARLHVEVDGDAAAGDHGDRDRERLATPTRASGSGCAGRARTRTPSAISRKMLTADSTTAAVPDSWVTRPRSARTPSRPTARRQVEAAAAAVAQPVEHGQGAEDEQCGGDRPLQCRECLAHRREYDNGARDAAADPLPILHRGAIGGFAGAGQANPRPLGDNPRVPHYFDREPAAPSRPRQVALRLPDVDVAAGERRGRVRRRAVDGGTRFLLRRAPPPPAHGERARPRLRLRPDRGDARAARARRAHLGGGRQPQGGRADRAQRRRRRGHQRRRRHAGGGARRACASPPSTATPRSASGWRSSIPC